MPGLLLVSVVAVGLMVLAIALLGVVDAGWTIAAALIAHALTTGLVMLAVVRMLANADREDS